MFRFTVNFIFFAINSRLFLFAITRIFRKIRLQLITLLYSVMLVNIMLSEAATQRCSQKKVFRKYTVNLPVISIKLQSNLIEITLRHGCSPVNLLLIFRTAFTKNTSERLLLCYGIFFVYQGLVVIQYSIQGLSLTLVKAFQFVTGTSIACQLITTLKYRY